MINLSFFFYCPGSQNAFSQIFSTHWCRPSWVHVSELSLVFPQLRYLKWKQRQPCSHSLILTLPAQPFPIHSSLSTAVAPEFTAWWRGDEAPCSSAILHSGLQTNRCHCLGVKAPYLFRRARLLRLHHISFSGCNALIVTQQWKEASPFREGGIYPGTPL